MKILAYFYHDYLDLICMTYRKTWKQLRAGSIISEIFMKRRHLAAQKLQLISKKSSVNLHGLGVLGHAERYPLSLA